MIVMTFPFYASFKNEFARIKVPVCMQENMWSRLIKWQALINQYIGTSVVYVSDMCIAFSNPPRFNMRGLPLINDYD
jgi:hypothetical protein